MILLFCLPHAGGSAQAYRDWQALLPPAVRVCPLELPGRGLRIGERPCADYDALAALLAREMVQQVAAAQRSVPGASYAVFGHSAGTAACFGAALRAAARLGRPPVHCFLSAGAPPHVPKRLHARLSDAQLIGAIRQLGGTPPQLLENAELLRWALPIVRADLAVYEGSALDAHRGLDCPFTLFAAAEDELAPDQVWAWDRYTAHPVRQVLLKGDHFAVLRQPDEVLGHVRRDLLG